MRTSRRGLGLGSTLLVVALLATVGLAMSGASVMHLNLSSRHIHQQEALNLARSVVSLAIENILANQDRGKTRDPQDDVQLQLQGEDPQAVGLVAFEKGSAQGVPYSTNNLGVSTSAAGDLSRPVPPNSVHLVGVGRSGGVERRVEAVLTIPPFPYAVASQGTIDASGGLQIAAVSHVPNGPVPPSELLPADLLSNANILLGEGSQIQGDVQAAGKVNFDPHAPPGTIEVKGAVRAGAGKRTIPTVKLQSYDPQNQSYPFTPLTGPTLPAQTSLQGMVRREGSLTVTGGLQLNGGLLYVNGDLTVEGGVQGKGLVVATGKTQIQGSSSLTSGATMALLSGQDLSIVGTGKQGSYFQGLVYTDGGFLADKVSVVGTMVSQGQQATFRDASLIQTPNSSNVTVTIGGSSGDSSFTYYATAGAGILSAMHVTGAAADVAAGSPPNQTVAATPGTADLALVIQLTDPSGDLRLTPFTLSVQQGARANVGGPGGGPAPTGLSHVPLGSGSAPGGPSASTTSGWVEGTPLDLPSRDWVDLSNTLIVTYGLSPSDADGLLTQAQQLVAPQGPQPVPPQPGNPGGVAPAIMTVDPSSVMTIQDRIRLACWYEH